MPSRVMRSFSRVSARLPGVHDNTSSTHRTKIVDDFAMTLERKQTQQQPVEEKWPMNGVIDDSLAVDIDFHLRQAIRLNAIVIRQIGWANHPPHRHDLFLTVDLHH